MHAFATYKYFTNKGEQTRSRRTCRRCKQTRLPPKPATPSTSIRWKVCRKCHERRRTKDFDWYTSLSTGSPRRLQRLTCRACNLDRSRERTAADPEKARRNTRERTVKWAYNLTMQELVRLLDSQDGGCAICRTPVSVNSHIDHDHDCCGRREKGCGKCVRGVLCKPCNQGLGMFDDNIQRLQGAISYLMRYSNG